MKWISLLNWVGPGFLLGGGALLFLADGNRVPGQEKGANSPFRYFRPEEYTEEGLKYRRWAAISFVVGVATSFTMPLVILSIKQALR